MARKVFNFTIEMEGVIQLLVQDVKKPKVEIGAVEHGGTNYNVKTAGGVKVGDAELMKIKAAAEGDSWAWDWMILAQDAKTGSGNVPEIYKRNIIFKELAPDNITTLNSWLWEGCWVKACDDSNSKRGAQDENVIETVTLSVDKVSKIK